MLFESISRLSGSPPGKKRRKKGRGGPGGLPPERKEVTPRKEKKKEREGGFGGSPPGRIEYLPAGCKNHASIPDTIGAFHRHKLLTLSVCMKLNSLPDTLKLLDDCELTAKCS